MRFALLLLALAASAAHAKPVTVHVVVALCDNATQGIVPVPAAIGDGNDPRTNLYWGAMYGVKTWLKREKWKVETAKVPNAAVLERLIARKTVNGREIVITADACAAAGSARPSPRSSATPPEKGREGARTSSRTSATMG
jgi:hypothetical protein